MVSLSAPIGLLFDAYSLPPTPRSSTSPSSNSPDATIVQHDDQGTFTMNMANPLPDSIDGPTSVTGPRPSVTLSPGYGNADVALTRTHKVFIAHAVSLAVAFMVILPLGVLQARLLRTFIPGKMWFGAHWILQWPVTTVLIVVGFALGVFEVNRIRSGHWNSTHKASKFSVCLCTLLMSE